MKNVRKYFRKYREQENGCSLGENKPWKLGNHKNTCWLLETNKRSFKRIIHVSNPGNIYYF